MPVSGLEDVVSISPLEIAREGQPTLYVPLEEVEGRQRVRIKLFDGAPVWEDEEASIGFRLETTSYVRRAVVSVNDHKELWMLCQWQPSMVSHGRTTYRYDFVVSPDNYDVAYTNPFSLTCGIARVLVRIEFRDGREALFESHDIVCLDEPRVGGQGGDHAEEGNVGEMYRTLVEANGNQASEWMFSPQRLDGNEAALSADDDTDWAHAALSRLLSTASETLDLVYDGLEDEGDSFPNETDDPDRASSFDTDENRAVRALLSSVAVRTEQVRLGLVDSVAELDELLKRLQTVISEAGARRGHEQTLPVRSLFERQRAQEASWLLEATDLAERSQLALQDFDDFVGGAYAVDESAFELPRLTRLYAEDERYAQLYEAMSTWASASQESADRSDVSLYAIKPDRLFEYYALHRMLTWLHDAGFREDMDRPRPIERFRYSLARTYSKYENEWRCANTYHLVRLANGRREEVDLYYQPVIYGSSREENGIVLHRLGGEDIIDNGAWTPDYVLVVRDAAGERTFLVDAKYVPWSVVMGPTGKLSECVDKYLTHTSNAAGGQPGEGVNGVWVLCGRLSARAMAVYDAEAEGFVAPDVLGPGISRTCGAVPWNRNTGKRKLRAFFTQLGIAPLPKAHAE